MYVSGLARPEGGSVHDAEVEGLGSPVSGPLKDNCGLVTVVVIVVGGLSEA